LLLVLLGGAVQAAGPPRPVPPDDTQDVLFLCDERPVLLRLHLRLDGRPAATRWHAFMARLFAFLDRNGDGVLDRTEAGRAPAPFQVRQLLQGDPYYYWSGSNVVLAGMDSDGDGTVTWAEFLSYYRRSPAGPVQAGPGAFAVGPGADALTNALFAALDTNKDGKLSRAELLAAPAVLSKFDSNDDELVSSQELMGSPGGYFTPPARGMPRRAASLILAERSPPGKRIAGPLYLARALLNRYDTNRDGKLSRGEIGLPRVLFKRLDTNRDGKLDVLELLRWLAAPPEVELIVDVGTGAMLAPRLGRGRLPAGVRKVSNRAVSLGLNGAVLTVSRGIVAPGRPVPAARQFLLNQFRALDRDRKGYITREQVQFRTPYLSGVLQVADRDGDGKLTEKELNTWLDLADSAIGCQTALTLADQGRGLFALLDSNGDGQLSVRELRNAWARLADRADATGHVTRKAIPRLYRLTIHQGGATYAALAGVPAVRAELARAAAPARGPLWFRKMDRNGDGDVSPAEWLGTPEEFRRIDTDGDGLISVEEAERYDKLRRKHARER
jgi:Ca2+-binding EF-hand superfamily protein